MGGCRVALNSLSLILISNRKSPLGPTGVWVVSDRSNEWEGEGHDTDTIIVSYLVEY